MSIYWVNMLLSTTHGNKQWTILTSGNIHFPLSRRDNFLLLFIYKTFKCHKTCCFRRLGRMKYIKREFPALKKLWSVRKTLFCFLLSRGNFQLKFRHENFQFVAAVSSIIKLNVYSMISTNINNKSFVSVTRRCEEVCDKTRNSF